MREAGLTRCTVIFAKEAVCERQWPSATVEQACGSGEATLRGRGNSGSVFPRPNLATSHLCVLIQVTQFP